MSNFIFTILQSTKSQEINFVFQFSPFVLNGNQLIIHEKQLSSRKWKIHLIQFDEERRLNLLFFYVLMKIKLLVKFSHRVLKKKINLL